MQPMIDRIIVPIDFSDASEHAARYAARLSRRLYASVHLIHVLEEVPVSPGPLEFYAGESPDVREERYQCARRRLNALAESVATYATRVTTEVRSGAIAESIGKAVLDYGADLVVMSTHGRTGLSHLLMGSVAEKVIQNARCPVLAIRVCGQVHTHFPQVESSRVALTL